MVLGGGKNEPKERMEGLTVPGFRIGKAGPASPENYFFVVSVVSAFFFFFLLIFFVVSVVS
jgi:hypothetical protein